MYIRSLLNKGVVKNSFWMIILQTFNMIIPLFTIPYITRILGSAEYGKFSIALNWVLYFQVIVEYGFELNGARRVAIDPSIKNVQIVLNGIVSSRILLTFISCITLITIWGISGLLLEDLICMLLLFFMVIGTGLSMTWVFQGLQEMKFITIANVVARLTSLIFIFLFVKTSEHIYRYCFFYSFSFFISGLIGAIICHNRYKLSFHFAKFTQICSELKEGWYLFLSAAMVCIFGNVGVTILVYFVDESAIGAYSAIHKISYVMNLIFLAISKALYPYISAGFANSQSDGFHKIRRAMSPTVLLFLLLGITIALLRNPIVIKVFGKEYAAYSSLIIPFVLQVIFAIVNNFIGVQSLVGNKYHKTYCSAIAIGMFVIVVSNLILIPFSGVYGAAYAALIAEMALTAILGYKNYKILMKCTKKSIM